MTAVSSTFDYFFGLMAFGGAYWFLNGILAEIRPFSATGDLLTYANWLWYGAIIVYLVAGAFWLPNMIKEWKGRNRF